MLCTVCHGHTLDNLLHQFAAFLLGHTHIEQRQFHVLRHIEFVDEVEALEHEAQFALAQVGTVVLAHLAHVLAVQYVGTLCGCVQQAKDVQQGGLATTAGAHDGHEFAFLHFQVHVLQSPGFHFVGLEDLLDV